MSPSTSTSSVHLRAVRGPTGDAARRLIENDVFEPLLDDDGIARLVAERARESASPHADLLESMAGMTLAEDEAAHLFERILAHRRSMATTLGRPVHVRVAALDFLTMTDRRAPRESRPIMVAPSFLERALEEASLDSTTGLPRAAHFMNLLTHQLLQRDRRVSVVFIDLDGFKLVNDEHGHARGDEVLSMLAEAARSVLRRGDVVARLGGDEFGLMLVGTSHGTEEAAHVVERLRHRFEELTKPLATSFSAGIAIASETGPAMTAEELVAIADRAMYAEKRQRAPR